MSDMVVGEKRDAEEPNTDVKVKRRKQSKAALAKAAAEEAAAKEIEKARVEAVKAAKAVADAQAKAAPYPTAIGVSVAVSLDEEAPAGQKVLQLCDAVVEAERARVKAAFGTDEQDTQAAVDDVLTEFLKACKELVEKDEILPEISRAKTFHELAASKKEQLQAMLKTFTDEEEQWLRIEQEQLAAPIVPKDDGSAIGEALAELKNQQQTGQLTTSLKHLQDSLTLQIDSLKQLARQAGTVLERAKKSSMALAKEVMEREMSVFPHVQSPEALIRSITAPKMANA
eukprot:scaffold879_cov410-Prasinococcus_capsulatus_cf.AAC.10